MLDAGFLILGDITTDYMDFLLNNATLDHASGFDTACFTPEELRTAQAGTGSLREQEERRAKARELGRKRHKRFKGTYNEPIRA